MLEIPRNLGGISKLADEESQEEMQNFHKGPRDNLVEELFGEGSQELDDLNQNADDFGAIMFNQDSGDYDGEAPDGAQSPGDI